MSEPVNVWIWSWSRQYVFLCYSDCFIRAHMFYKKHYKMQEFCYLGFFSLSQVHAVDMDKGENGEVRYELIKGHGELFKVCRKTGEVTLKQNLEGHNREYELIIAAYDGGRIMH